MLLRDWRAGELRVLALALVLAVGGVSSVAFFADRVRQALTREAHQVLGADMLMTADHAWAPEFRDEIVRRGVQRAESMNFVSMVRAGNETLLAAVKAVTPGYPLRGRLRIAPGLNLPDVDTDAVPPRGTVWLDERMMAALKVRPGDAIELGRARFRDRKSTRLNSSHLVISYAVFCLKKKKKRHTGTKHRRAQRHAR